MFAPPHRVWSKSSSARSLPAPSRGQYRGSVSLRPAQGAQSAGARADRARPWALRHGGGPVVHRARPERRRGRALVRRPPAARERFVVGHRPSSAERRILEHGGRGARAARDGLLAPAGARRHPQRRQQPAGRPLLAPRQPLRRRLRWIRADCDSPQRHVGGRRFGRRDAAAAAEGGAPQRLRPRLSHAHAPVGRRRPPAPRRSVQPQRQRPQRRHHHRRAAAAAAAAGSVGLRRGRRCAAAWPLDQPRHAPGVAVR